MVQEEEGSSRPERGAQIPAGWGRRELGKCRHVVCVAKVSAVLIVHILIVCYQLKLLDTHLFTDIFVHE